MPSALIVEDDPSINTLFQEALKLKGFNTFSATSVAQAITILATEIPDIVLVDMNLPNQLGTELLAHINATPRLASIKRVMITANAMSESRAEELGVDLFMVKPVALSELLTLVNRLIGKKG